MVNLPLFRILVIEINTSSPRFFQSRFSALCNITPLLILPSHSSDASDLVDFKVLSRRRLESWGSCLFWGWVNYRLVSYQLDLALLRPTHRYSSPLWSVLHNARHRHCGRVRWIGGVMLLLLSGHPQCIALIRWSWNAHVVLTTCTLGWKQALPQEYQLEALVTFPITSATLHLLEADSEAGGDQMEARMEVKGLALGRSTPKLSLDQERWVM